jgi:hypothetical protein
MNNQNKISFKEWFFNESKAIVFPPEIQQKLHDISNKMLSILIELAKKEQGKNHFYQFVDKIEFNDPYLNKKRTYDVYAVRTGSEETNKDSSGWQAAYHERPHIVVTTNMAFPELEKNQKWLDSLEKGTMQKIQHSIVYNNKQKALEDIYNTLSHELAHAYDPTLSKGYRYKQGSPEEYVKKQKALMDRDAIGTFLDKTGIGKLFGRKNPEEEFQQHLKDSEKTKLVPYFHPSQHDGTPEGKKQAYKKYFEQEPEFVAQMSGWSNYVINYARQSIQNDDPNTIVVKQLTVFKDLINYIRKGTSHRETVNPLIQASGFQYVKSYMKKFKENKPSMYRKLLEKISNVALEAYNIMTKHIEDNNIASQVSPETSKWLHENQIDPSIKVTRVLRTVGAKNINTQEQYSATIKQQTINFHTNKSNVHNKKHKTDEYKFMIRYEYPKNSVDEKILNNLEYVISIPDDNNYEFVPIKKVKGLANLESYMTEVLK